MNISTRRLLTSITREIGGFFVCKKFFQEILKKHPQKRSPISNKWKNHEKLAGFGREFTNSEIPEKPVKSRIFGDLQGVKNAPRGGFS